MVEDVEKTISEIHNLSKGFFRYNKISEIKIERFKEMLNNLEELYDVKA